MWRCGIAGLVGAVGVAGATISLGLASTSARAVAGGHTGWSLQHPAIPAGSSKTYLDGVSCFVACTSVGAYVKGKSTVPLAERWGGKKWAIEHPRPPKGSKNAQLRGVSCFSARICTAVGFAVGPGGHQVALAERWKSAEWSPQRTARPKGKGSALNSISCTSGNSCMAVGAYGTGKGGRVAALAERWNGKKWSIERPRDPSGAARTYLYGVWCTWSSNCMAVGYFIGKSKTAQPLAEHWNGKKWALRRVPAPPGATSTYVLSVACPTGGTCIAVGYYKGKAGADVPLAALSSGAKWSLQHPAPPAGARGSFLESVSCTAIDACTGVGYFADSTGADVPLAEHLGGGGWSLARPPSPHGTSAAVLQGVTCSSTTSCLAVGYDEAGGTHEKPQADHWHG